MRPAAAGEGRAAGTVRGLLAARRLPRRAAGTVDRTLHVPVLLPLLAALAAGLATTWSALTGSLFLYGDARAHEDVARHVTDALNPGLSQLGSVWLPLPHLLMVPLVAIEPLWHSGAAGAIVGGICFIVTVVRTWSLVVEMFGDRVAGWVAAAVVGGSLDLLYVQGTALTEPVLLTFIVLAAWRLARWTRTGSTRDLVWAALAVLSATMTRYEGWALLAVALVAVALWARTHMRRPHDVQSRLIVFGTVSGYGIGLWVFYNWVIFGDPLYFIHSSASTQSQQARLGAADALSTRWDIVESLLTYGWAMLNVIGAAVMIAAAVGLVALVAFRRTSRARLALVVAVLAAPPVFNVVALWMGQTTLRVPQRAPFEMWNQRYALVALPLCALGVGGLVAVLRRVAVLRMPSVAVAVAAVVLAATATPAVLQEGRTGVSNASGGLAETVAATLRADYEGGLVLADDSACSATMFASGLQLREFVSVGMHPYFENALTDPSSSVRWVIAVDGDSVDTDMHAHADRFSAFRLVVRQGAQRLYER